jgi:hypothetical protein
MALDRDELHALLDRIAAWDPAAWFRHRELYRETYGPGALPFLPPTCAHPIVLKATECRQQSWLFGPAPSPRAVASRTAAEFENHARAVARLLGRRSAQARGVVLASEDLLRSPTAQVVHWLEIAAQVFPLTASPQSPRPRLSERPLDSPLLDGAFAFLDSPAAIDRTAPDWSRLATHGLRWVDLGIASGSPDVRATHGLAWDDETAIALVQMLKQAGIGLGIVLPLGCGGPELSASHIGESARLARSLPLARGDIIYLVDATEIAGAEPRSTWSTHDLVPPNRHELARQRNAFKNSLAGLRAHRGVKVVPYTLDKA